METDETLVAEFAQLILDQAAPEELAIFDETAADYFRDPEGTLDPKRRDEALGFGIDLALLTPYALAVAGSVLSFLVSTFGEAVKGEAKPVIADLVRRLFRRDKKDEKEPDSPEPVPALTREQAAQVREVALARAKSSGLDDARAGLLADAVVGGLYVSG